MNGLQQAILSILEEIDLKKLKSSSALLTSCYREGGSLTEEDELLAYLIVRLPATYAVLCRVLSHISSGTILDLASWTWNLLVGSQNHLGKYPPLSLPSKEKPTLLSWKKNWNGGQLD